jgi:hypothetical protein
VTQGNRIYIEHLIGIGRILGDIMASPPWLQREWSHFCHGITRMATEAP